MNITSIFVFIIIAVFILIFNKKKEEAEKKARRILPNTGKNRKIREIPYRDALQNSEKREGVLKDDFRKLGKKTGSKENIRVEAHFEPPPVKIQPNLIFNQESLVYGIVMSEVLGKPKCLKNKP